MLWRISKMYFCIQQPSEVDAKRNLLDTVHDLSRRNNLGFHADLFVL